MTIYNVLLDIYTSINTSAESFWVVHPPTQLLLLVLFFVVAGVAAAAAAGGGGGVGLHLSGNKTTTLIFTTCVGHCDDAAFAAPQTETTPMTKRIMTKTTMMTRTRTTSACPWSAPPRHR